MLFLLLLLLLPRSGPVLRAPPVVGRHCAREDGGPRKGLYEVRNGRILCDHFIVFPYFDDVLPGDGGLLVLPGSRAYRDPSLLSAELTVIRAQTRACSSARRSSTASLARRHAGPPARISTQRRDASASLLVRRNVLTAVGRWL